MVRVGRRLSFTIRRTQRFRVVANVDFKFGKNLRKCAFIHHHPSLLINPGNRVGHMPFHRDYRYMHNHAGNGDMVSVALFGKAWEARCRGKDGEVTIAKIPLFKVRRYKEYDDWHSIFHIPCGMLTVGFWGAPNDKINVPFDKLQRYDLPSKWNINKL